MRSPFNVIVISSILLVLLVSLAGLATAANTWVGGWKTIGDIDDAGRLLLYPTSVAISYHNNVYVTDTTGINYIMKLPSGGSWTSLGTHGNSPIAVVADSWDDVFVLNSGIGTSGMVYKYVNNSYNADYGKWIDITK